MSWKFVVLAFLALATTTGVMAVSLDCEGDATNCTLQDVRSNNNNEIEFSWTFDSNLAQKVTAIEIKQSKFPYFPSNFFKVMPNLKVLHAQDCGLVILDIFGLQSSDILADIETLDLADNLVEFLKAYSFYRTKNLVNLDLSNNRLSYMDALAFHGLPYLKILSLTKNQLTNLDPSVFKPLQSLFTLYLNNNQLKILNLDMFHDNVNLDSLIVTGNKISTLQATLINNVTDLVDLRGNQLVDISALRKMKGMHYLYLSDNKEVDLSLDDFAEMTQLYRLRLDGVNLQRYFNNNNQFLKPLQQLWSIHVGRNNLSLLSQLPSLPSLEDLIIDNNEFTGLDVNALGTQFPKLTHININDNPWSCQVLQNLVDELKRNHIILQFRGIYYPEPPAGSKSIRYIVCDAKVVTNNDERKNLVPDHLVCGRPTLSGSQFIFGGQRSVRGAWPWLVAVHKNSGGKVEFLCGGSLISSKLVISAAHCITDVTISQILLYIGSHDIRNMRDTNIQQRGAQQLVIHPDYFRQNKAFSDADIGLIILLQSVIYTDFIKPICLWPTDEANQNIVGQKGVVAGWGFDTSNQGTATPNYVEMPLVSTLTCLYDDPSYRKITSNRTLCVGEKNGKGPCHGDSGSGFVMKKAEKWVLRGVVSAGLPDIVQNTCDLTKYVVLSDTVKFQNWILTYL